MTKEIMIDGKNCIFKTSAAIPRMYRMKFKRDLFNDFGEIDNQIKKQTDVNNSTLPIHTLTTFENIAYLMHKHGDPSQPNTVEEWLDQFDTLDIYNVFPEILELWADGNEQKSVAKKKTEK